MESGLTEQQIACIPKAHFKLIPIKDLVSNQEYQRPLSESHIIKAIEEFDVFQINPVKVSRRDGINYVFDGQHTIEIVATKSGSRETPVWCMVFEELEYQIRTVRKPSEGKEFGLTAALDAVREKNGLCGFVPDGVSFDIGLPDAYRETMWRYAGQEKA